MRISSSYAIVLLLTAVLLTSCQPMLQFSYPEVGSAQPKVSSGLQVSPSQEPPLLEIKGYRTEREKQQLLFAHHSAICTLKKMREQLKNQVLSAPDPIQAWNEEADLRKWMGQLRETQQQALIHRLDSQLKEMSHRLTQESLTYDVEHGWASHCRFVRTNAFVSRLSKQPEIHFCPDWFQQGAKEQISTLIHELGHTFGMSHPLKTDTPKEAFQLAREHPELALQSPENYECLAESYICYWRGN
jgi:hypothetical protein